LKITFGNKTEKTKIIKKNCNPLWNESFYFKASAGVPLKVKIDCYDHELIGKDNYIGSCEFPVEGALGIATPLQLTLLSNSAKGSQGTIYLSVTLGN
jgi:Ca2+-dependent lipid-binding protein